MRNLKIRYKITLWYALFLLILLTIFSIFLYAAISQLLYQHNKEIIKTDADQVLSILHIEGNMIRIEEPYKILSTNTYFVVFDVSGNANIESQVLPELLKLPIESEQIRYISIDDNRWTVYDSPLSSNGELIGWIRVSRSLEDLSIILRNLKIILLISVPLYIFFTSLGGLFLADRALRPIDSITKTARKIIKGDLNQRLKVTKTEDEVGRLGVTFNEMIDKLEAFIKKERQFTSDASHELRTPLAIISAQAEQVLADKPGTSEYRKAVTNILDECKKMSYMISQLLMLYRSEEGKYQLSFEILDLGIIGEEVVREYKNISKQKGIEVKFFSGGSTEIKADQTLITRLLINLIDNALKYNNKNGHVILTIKKQDGFAVIIVEDDGPGIPEEDIPHIFDRFYQAEKARGNQGSGLGLSIVKWIVEAHNGAISVESTKDHGSKFIVKLPAGL